METTRWAGGSMVGAGASVGRSSSGGAAGKKRRDHPDTRPLLCRPRSGETVGAGWRTCTGGEGERSRAAVDTGRQAARPKGTAFAPVARDGGLGRLGRRQSPREGPRGTAFTPMTWPWRRLERGGPPDPWDGDRERRKRSWERSREPRTPRGIELAPETDAGGRASTDTRRSGGVQSRTILRGPPRTRHDESSQRRAPAGANSRFTAARSLSRAANSAAAAASSAPGRPAGSGGASPGRAAPTSLAGASSGGRRWGATGGCRALAGPGPRVGRRDMKWPRAWRTLTPGASRARAGAGSTVTTALRGNGDCVSSSMAFHLGGST